MEPQPLPVYGISRIWLEVRQLGRAIHFYRDIMRLPLVRIERDMAFFDVDGQQLVLTEPQVFPDGSVAGVLCHVAFAIDPQAEAAYAQKIQESGGNTYSVGFGHYVDDPDGNLIEFWNESQWPHQRRAPLAGNEIAPLQAIVESSLLVTDSAQALEFYRDWLGLQNLAAVPEQGQPFMRARFPSGQDILLWLPGIFMGTARAGRNMRLTLACASLREVAEFLSSRQIRYTLLQDKLYFRDPFGHCFEVETVSDWPLPASGKPECWSYPKRPTESLR
ncbi:MAG: VOC family protein [Anaerolineales bacterium]|nr:VOC family protein [Anaerolineales bacterium]